MDVHDKLTRSYNMSKIKGKNTKPEILVRKFLHTKGLRFRLHDSNLPGKPDIILPKYKSLVLVNGCFWHGHKCQRGDRMPKTNRSYWSAKIARNRERDTTTLSALREAGWDVLVIWECETDDNAALTTILERFLKR